MSKEVAVTTPKVPDLVQPQSALHIESNDVVLPRIKLGQPNASIVQDGDVPKHCIYTVVGSDDPEPTVLYEYGDEDGVLIHVLAMRKSWSLSEDGDLQTWAWDDPSRHPDAWVAYNYVVALPEHDPDVPYKLLFTRSGAPAAKQMNTVLARNAARGPSFMTAFRLRTDERKNTEKKHTWTVPRVRSVDATQEGVDISAKLFEQIASSLDSAVSTGSDASRSDEPAI